MKKTFLLFTVYCLLSTTIPVLAAEATEYKLLQPIPLSGAGSVPTEKTTAGPYIQGLFKLIIAIAGGLAVLQIIFGGIEYMSTDAFQGKNDAKNRIQNAIWGLMLAISAWLILFTVNPKLVNFDLKIPVQSIPTPSSTGGGGGGCQGNCIYSYVNSSGQTISYRDCLSCSNASSFGLDIKASTVNGTAAQINAVLGNKLATVSDTPSNPAFVVTETWPPTVNHISQRQYDGTAVDISLSSPNANNIVTFINNATRQGLVVVYEVSTTAERQAYINAGVPATSIIAWSGITAEHFSVY